MEWTAESIAALTVAQVKALRENAAKRDAQGLVGLCDADLGRRNPLRASRKGFEAIRAGQTVQGFHFVCPTKKGIMENPDGTVWTGTWVVDKNHAERAVKGGGYIALHVAKSEPSYLQGVIKSWRTRERERAYAGGQLTKTRFGIDFLIELTDRPLQWYGDGSGEKGYFYGDSADTNPVS
ncbi:MAG: hypothetical protein WB611_26840 [Stellaceae bacterium]